MPATHRPNRPALIGKRRAVLFLFQSNPDLALRIQALPLVPLEPLEALLEFTGPADLEASI